MLVVDKNTFKTEVLENEGYVLVDLVMVVNHVQL